MTAIFNRDEVPGHLFILPELDFSNDLFAERLSNSWFRLGAWTVTGVRDERNVEDEVFRQSLLLNPNAFAEIFDKLNSVGNVIGNLGKPGGRIIQSAENTEYRYAPFHQFPFPFCSSVGEALVFLRWDSMGPHLFINPDLWLFFDLEERTLGSGIWWDPRRGIETLRQQIIEQDNLQIVDVRSDYLFKYLQARQMSLLVGHYRQLLLFDPMPEKIQAFVKEDTTIGTPDRGAKAILDNWGLREDIVWDKPFLQRRLHLWFEVKPPKIDVDDPWTDAPNFDRYTFTLPTRKGPVAPARWCYMRGDETHTFDGGVCDFMDRVYFRQEVLMKYQSSSGFEVMDDGSVRSNYWGLVRSTSRLGNELLSTGIGDFAEGITLAEWPHWRQYSVEPPSLETVKALREEQSIPDAVNSLVDSLQKLNRIFGVFADSFEVITVEVLWHGSVESLAGRQLKWVYPVTADDDELLKRATLLSTVVIEALSASTLRTVLRAIGSTLHMSEDNPPRSLGSRNLLQRLTLSAVLIEKFKPHLSEIPTLIRVSEGKARDDDALDLQAELESCNKELREEFAPLAFLYDLRTHSGIAHAPNKDRVVSVAKRLGLPEQNWNRRNYLRLLNLVTGAVERINEHLWAVVVPE
jgi:hypothetical protein